MKQRMPRDVAVARALAILAFAACAIGTAPRPAAGQSSEATSSTALREALRLRDAGDFAAAARAFDDHVRAHPADAHAARLLAETLYWSGDIAAARAAWENALRRHPLDVTLRLEYGRMLAQLAERGARALLLPLRDEPEAAAEAEALLGMLAYWAGDLTAAKRHLEDALRHAPDHADANRALGEIRTASRPWLRAGAAVDRDTQPVSTVGGQAEVGVYVTPLLTFGTNIERRRHAAGDTSRVVTSAGATFRGYWPALRIDTELSGRILAGSAVDGTDWSGRAALGVRLPARLAVTWSAEREPYMRTAASLSTPVVVRSLEGRLDWWSRSGWIGQGAWRRIRYPDGNEGESVYGWLLAPVLRADAAELRIGYAYGGQDTRESRFVPSASPDGGDPAAIGRYVPYYTPAEQSAHRVAAAVSIAPRAPVSFQANGSFAFRATEAAPHFSSPPGAGGPPLLGFYTRSYHPLEARGELGAAISPALHARFGVEHARTAQWDTTRGSLVLLYRFGVDR